MNERTLSALLVIPTAVVVLVLAALLYNWSNQVSESTTVRLADSLQMSMANWHLNLYRDMSDVAGALRVDSENSGDLDLFARRFREWAANAQYRDVASNLYALDPAPGAGQALRLDPEDFRFKPSEWPAALASLREKLAVAPARETPSFPRGLAGWKFEWDPPVLARAIQPAGRWLVIELDKAVIESRMLPDLAKRYFMGVDGLDYLVAVVSSPHPREVVYSSDPGFGEDEIPDADGRMDVFGDVTSKQFGGPLYVFHQLSDTAKLAGVTGSMGTQWFPLLDEQSSGEGWQLIVRHRRGGPLGAFVAEMHRRDLAISFGVLFLLVAMVAVLVVISLRAHRLGKLQMDFVTAISHELRSPLTIIGSAAENLAHGVVGTPDQIEQYGKAIQGQTRQLSRLVEEVLLFAATSEDRHRYNPRPLEVSAIVDSTLAATSDLIEAAEFVVERDVPANLPQVHGDLAALSQCLQNLVTNALKYGGTQTQKWIGIRASLHQDSSGNREVRIGVSDRGPGIDLPDLPHIFEPFFRSSSATKAQIHGTGLGLSLAKNIAEAMQGQLTVVSFPGKGTTFTLHLPAGAPG